VVICHHGVRSLRAAAYLEHCGFGDVVNLSGGIDAWARTVDPAMAVY
jgi:rhodanese-related sulfurtransferase